MTVDRERRVDDKKFIDLHINIPTLGVILLQTFAAASAITTIYNENAAQTKQLTEMTARIYQVERAIGGSQVIESRMSALEIELRIVRTHLDQMNAKRDR